MTTTTTSLTISARRERQAETNTTPVARPRGLLARLQKPEPIDNRPVWLRNLRAKDLTDHAA